MKDKHSIPLIKIHIKILVAGEDIGCDRDGNGAATSSKRKIYIAGFCSRISRNKEKNKK